MQLVRHRVGPGSHAADHANPRQLLPQNVREIHCGDSRRQKATAPPPAPTLADVLACIPWLIIVSGPGCISLCIRRSFQSRTRMPSSCDGPGSRQVDAAKHNRPPPAAASRRRWRDRAPTHAVGSKHIQRGSCIRAALARFAAAPGHALTCRSSASRVRRLKIAGARPDATALS
eukprot:364584-Chlamydomonas_euryale.AAC.3